MAFLDAVEGLRRPQVPRELELLKPSNSQWSEVRRFAKILQIYPVRLWKILRMRPTYL